jgi:hypothetical protein
MHPRHPERSEGFGRTDVWSRCFARLSITLLCCAFLMNHAVLLAAPTTQANDMVELAFTSSRHLLYPFDQVTLDVTFTDPSGNQRRVPAFWAGGQKWKVRYASTVVGSHRFRVESPDIGDTGLRQQGTIEVIPYKGNNPLYVHGPLRVSDDHRYLQHADGTPFFWLGDTWWMGLTKRLSFPDEFQALAQDRKSKGFNVIQIVAGLYPDMPAFDERGANEAGFPWEKDYSRIRPEYFDAADQRIMCLVEQGFVPCIVGAWGYHLPWLGVEKMKQHQRYLYARWGALPIVWCIAGELNLPYYLTPGFPRNDEKQTAEWEEVMGYCRSINGFDRLITAHPTGIPPMSMRGVMKNPKLLDFDMLQTPHGQLEALGPTVEDVRFSYSQQPPMPVVNAEPSYEMLLDKTPAEIARMMFWVSWTNGVKGYTYGANGIWQLNRRDQPYGNSPHGGNYGKIAWDEAMKLAGSTQVALGKKLLERFEWQRFEPKPQWATWVDEKSNEGNKYLVPHAMGIERKVRVVYVPRAKAIRINELERDLTYLAFCFDPVTGEEKKVAQIRGSDDGTAQVEPPAFNHDWVLVLRS